MEQVMTRDFEHGSSFFGLRPGKRIDAQAPTGFLVCDKEGRISLCSESAAKVLSIAAPEVEGRSLGMFLKDISTGTVGMNLARLSAENGWRSLNAMTGDGRIQLLEVTATKFNVDRTPFYLIHLRSLNSA